MATPALWARIPTHEPRQRHRLSPPAAWAAPPASSRLFRQTAVDISVDEIKSAKGSKEQIRKIRLSVGKLLKIGLNKVGLFELIATPPADGTGSRPWAIAAHIAGKTLEAMGEAFAQRLPSNSPVGHGVAAVGGINGRQEFASGSVAYDTLREPKENPFLHDPVTKNSREELERNLYRIMRD